MQSAIVDILVVQQQSSRCSPEIALLTAPSIPRISLAMKFGYVYTRVTPVACLVFALLTFDKSSDGVQPSKENDNDSLVGLCLSLADKVAKLYNWAHPQITLRTGDMIKVLAY